MQNTTTGQGTTITRALFALCWTTFYPSLLESADGALITRASYRLMYRDSRFGRPWQDDHSRYQWNGFWSAYTGTGGLRRPGADRAWERIIPLRLIRPTLLRCPDRAQARTDILLYPGAISVIVQIAVEGRWSIADLPTRLMTIRRAHDWGFGNPGRTSRNRNLDGIAGQLRDEGLKFIATRFPPEPGPTSLVTIAAPMAGTGHESSLDVTSDEVRSCLAGLAVLGPPGTYSPDNLLDVNSDPRLAARVYATSRGHAIWHPAQVLQQPPGEALGCLCRNQVGLVAHIDALAKLVTWAGERIGARAPIRPEVQPLIRNAVVRLRQLSAGEPEKTYRSRLAQRRIEKRLFPALNAIDAAL